MYTRREALALLAGTASAGCTTIRPAGFGIRPSRSPPVRAETVVANLELPWDAAVAPTGEVFVTERTGRLLHLDGDHLRTVARPADVIDAGVQPARPDDEPYWESWWVEGGEGGLLGVAVDPAYPDPAYVYVYYTARGEGERRNRVARLDVSAEDPASTTTVVLGGIPAGDVHNGGRITFGPDGHLWVTTGDAGDGGLAQDGRSLAGKVLRCRHDGRPAPDNPRVEGRDRRVYTLGHRNPQGLAWLPDGTPFVTEHGPDGRDEFNRLVPGGNYGWPLARRAGGYAGTDFRRPLLSTGPPPSWAPSGGVFYTGSAVPAWQNRFVFGQLFGQRVGVATFTPAGQTPPSAPDAVRFDADWLDDRYTVTVRHALSSLGRVRNVFQGPNGDLYATTSNRDGRAQGDDLPRRTDDRLVRIRPA